MTHVECPYSSAVALTATKLVLSQQRLSITCMNISWKTCHTNITVDMRWAKLVATVTDFNLSFTQVHQSSQ